MNYKYFICLAHIWKVLAVKCGRKIVECCKIKYDYD